MSITDLPAPQIGEPRDMTGRRFLVTGAGGFIGSHVSEALLARGAEVVGVESFAPSYERHYKERNLDAFLAEPRFTLAVTDLRSDPLDPLLEGIDVVINEAAIAGLPRSWSDVGFYMDANVTALARLIDASRRAGVSRFVQASTSSVYGTSACGDESQPTQPVSPYGISKLAAEHLLLAHVHANDLPATILRYFSIYGPRQRPDMAYHIFIEKLRAGEPLQIFGDGRQSRSNTYVHDCVAGTIAAVDGAEVGEIYNIGGGVRLELLEAVELLTTALDVRPILDFSATRPGDQRDTFADTAKAREAFGYAPTTDPDVGLTEQVAWHLDVLSDTTHEPAPARISA